MLPRRCDHFGVGTLLKGTSVLLWKCPRLRNGWINCLVKYTKVYGSEGNRSVKKTSFLRDSVSNLNLPPPKTPATPWNQSEGSSGGSAPLTSSVGDGEGPDGSDTFNNNSGDVTAPIPPLALTPTNLLAFGAVLAFDQLMAEKN